MAGADETQAGRREPEESRPGFGERHPVLATILAAHTPVESREVAWLGGEVPLRVSAYHTNVDLPDELITSVRCIVRVGDSVVCCENGDARHPWPGGRREPGESYMDTAVREVHEETGWVVEPAGARYVGWLHLEHLAPRREGYVYPYPDFLQLILCARAERRTGGADADWSDTEGYEGSSRLLGVDEAVDWTSPDQVATTFLRACDR
jgi:hypothetical protein